LLCAVVERSSGACSGCRFASIDLAAPGDFRQFELRPHLAAMVLTNELFRAVDLYLPALAHLHCLEYWLFEPVATFTGVKLAAGPISFWFKERDWNFTRHKRFQYQLFVQKS
jgi:hypothetical protein